MSSEGLLQIQNFLRYVKNVSWRSPGVAGKEACNTGICHGPIAAVTRSNKFRHQWPCKKCCVLLNVKVFANASQTVLWTILQVDLDIWSCNS